MPHAHKGRNIAITSVIVIIILIVSALGSSYFITPGHTSTSTSHNASSLSSLTTSSTVTSTISNSPGLDPDFTNGTAEISYPANYTTLSNYALSLINTNRESFGLQNVSMSLITSGQQHADSMDYHNTFGHWDVQGYKPYMRYTMLGGRGSLDENVAFGYCTNDLTNSSYVRIAACNLVTIRNAIYDSESAMMFNDSRCCDNGHRENILDPMHTSVSIGVAYNATANVVFLVEDFENVYLNYSTFSLSSDAVSLSGNYIKSVDLTPWESNQTSTYSGASIAVFYDKTPQEINSLPTVSCLSEGSACPAYSQCGSSNELNESAACTYWGAYDPGEHIGAVFGPCPNGYTCSGQLSGGGIASYASTWQASQSSFDIQFSLTSFTSQNGTGVYTIYLYPNNSNDTITSLSIFVS